MTKYLRVVALGLVLALVAVACGEETITGAADPDEPAITEVGEGEGQVNIISWAGYIERGATPGYEYVDWVTQFEADTDCLVQNKIANTSDEMVALMQEGTGFDLVTASGDASLRLVQGKTVQPVNLALVPSYSTVDERLQNAPWHTVDTDGDGTAEHYGVPYQSGSDVLMYDTEVFPEPPTSWSVVFEDTTLGDGQSNAGRIEAYDGAIALASVALYVKAIQPELGIGDPYALNTEQFEAVLEMARKQRDLVFRYWHDAFVQMDDFATGPVVASTSWPFQRNQLQFADPPVPVDSVVPVEGATGWADTTMMHVDAPHPNCAYKWLEWSLNSKLQGDLAWWFGTVPAVLDACAGNELLTDTGCEYNGLSDFDKILFWKTPQADCFDTDPATECVPYHEWVTKYVAVIGGR